MNLTTERIELAGKILVQLVANEDKYKQRPEVLAERAVSLATALCKELNKVST